MNPTKPENPPAFPYAFHFPDQDGEPGGINFGMTLRDYFAAKALNGLCSNPTSYAGAIEQHREKKPGFTDADICATLARWSYDYADAMLAARKEGGQP